MRHDLPLLEMYGLAESSGICTLNTMDDWRLGSPGRVMTGTKIRIIDPDFLGEGEVINYFTLICIFNNSPSAAPPPHTSPSLYFLTKRVFWMHTHMV